MAFLAVSGEPGCRQDELARLAAERLQWELVTEADLSRMMVNEFGESVRIPDQAWMPLAVSLLAGLGSGRNLVICSTGAETLGADLPDVLRVHVTAPEKVRLENLVSDRGLNRSEAKASLRKMAAAQALTRKRRCGKKASPNTCFDVIVNSLALEAGPLSAQAAAGIQFKVRLRLARYGLVPRDRVHAERKAFGHPSEEVFANLLDFYRITWDYEPRSFPLQWDKDGKVSEAFTPDFYLPEFDLYVELTTMKQANVTRKNRKIRLLRAIYPHVNIQIFYQKDVQDLVMKYRLPESLAR
jgi:hypothetical protein